jgi:oxaloacetate decarboxylase beta subunit
MREWVIYIMPFIGVQQVFMILVGAVLLYLAIAKNFEPNLLLSIGFGTILANIPGSSAVGNHGALTLLFEMGISNELFPLLIFIAVGAMCDFTPLISNPLMFVFGLAAQAGIFITMAAAYFLFGFSLHESAAIGVIGAADGPTAIYVANRFAQRLVPQISIAAYTYMAMVPIIQPPVIKLMTTKKERAMRMNYVEKPVSRGTLILFPIAVTAIAGILAPASVALIGFLMFGNLLRVSGVTERLADAAQNELANIVTILLGLAVSAKMTGPEFANLTTLAIIGMGLFAFVFDTAGGVLSAKLLNMFLPEGKKVNPMIGAAGISAFPMASRVIQRLGQQADPGNYLLMHAVGANIAGQIGSVLAGGLLLAWLGG